LIALTLVTLAQSTQTPEELQRQLRQKQDEINLKQKEIELIEKEIELEKKKRELKSLRDGPSDPPAATTERGVVPHVEPATPPGSSSDTSVAPANVVAAQPTATQPPAAQPSDDCTAQELNILESTRYSRAACQLINRIEQNGGQEIPVNFAKKQLTDILTAKVSTNEITKSFFLEAEKKRTDKQIGSSPESSGTTSLAVKGGTPALIGWAVEQGAATSSVSGNTVTVRANPFNLAKAIFLKQGLIEIRDVDEHGDAFSDFMKRVSVGVSFDTTRGFDTPTFSGSRQQVSAVSLRYEFINHRNPLSKRHQGLRNEFFSLQTANLDRIAHAINDIFDRNTRRFQPEYTELNLWLDETNAELAQIPAGVAASDRRARIVSIVHRQLEKLPVDKLSQRQDFKDIIESFSEGSRGFKEARDKLLDKINDGAVATFEYTNNRETIAPDTSNFRFIWEKGIFRGTDFTFNASLTMYNRQPDFPGVRRIRDFQFALQTDTKVGGGFGGGDMLLSFAGRYQRLNGDTVDPLGMVTPGTRGDVAIGQIKLTIPIADWGIRLPLSVTFANRTDLIKESNVRANFGFTFDLDPIFARLKAFRIQP
jgi:hypothetical protein